MKKILSILSMLTLCLSLVFPGETILADTSGSSEHVVIAEEVSNPDYYAGGVIQECLNEAKDYATAGKPYRIVVPAGKYTLYEPLRIYSNTILDLKGVTFTKSYDKNNKVNLICTGTMAPIAYEGEKGYETRNISILNGTFDGNGSIGTLAKFIHAGNVTLKNCTFKNTYNSHAIELACVDGFTISNSRFSDLKLVKSKDPLTYEAIQLDITSKKHIEGYRSEAASVKNVTVSNCTFDNVPRGIGSHTAVYNLPYSNIKILNNTFNNISSSAIEGMYWKNVEISGNTITNTPKGIQFSVFRDGGVGTFLPSDLSKEGKVPTSVSDKYKEEKNYNIKIVNNKITLCKKNDPYQTTVRAGIRLLGTNLTKINNLNDGSKNVPLKNYYMSGVTVEKNTITTTGYGFHIDNTRNSSFKNNTIVYIGKVKADKTQYHGIYVKNKSKSLKLDYNTINSTEQNAISITEGSSASQIIGNTINKPGKYGISVYEKGASASTISKNKIVSPADSGINVYNKATVTTISSNTIDKAKIYGIKINTSARVKTVSKNSIANSGDCAIAIGLKSTVTYTDSNKITTAKNSGIRIYGKSTISNIRKNTIKKAKKYGISVTSGSVVKKASGNKISGSKVKAYRDSTSKFPKKY